MTRVMLATEGISDEIVGAPLIQHVLPGAVVDCSKKFTARSVDVVMRTIPTFVRAAHFGFYDWLVIHVDLDDTLPGPGRIVVSDSPRWQTVDSTWRQAFALLKPGIPPGRAASLRVALMTPHQSIEAWLMWGANGKDGKSLERVPRHLLKKALFGEPQLDTRIKAGPLATQLVAQMQANDQWPASLQSFVDQFK